MLCSFGLFSYHDDTDARSYSSSSMMMSSVGGPQSQIIMYMNAEERLQSVMTQVIFDSLVYLNTFLWPMVAMHHCDEYYWGVTHIIPSCVPRLALLSNSYKDC